MQKQNKLALSGGADSTYLFYKKRKNILFALHVNYHLREDSNIDENISINNCRKLNKAIYILDLSNYEILGNIQSEARRIRFGFFKIIMNEKILLIGHNNEDRLETNQIQRKRLNIFNKHVKGLSKYSSFNEIKIMRPIILVNRKKIIKYLKKNEIEYSVDSSNEKPIYERNKLRILNQLENVFFLKAHYFLTNLFRSLEDKKIKKLFIK
jgi:tRNA(Ile)-lysidine synthase